jgi:hypothetical protein
LPMLCTRVNQVQVLLNSSRNMWWTIKAMHRLFNDACYRRNHSKC